MNAAAFGAGRLRRNAFFSVTGLAVPNVLMLILTPVLLHEMGSTAYGLWQIALAAFGFLGVVELGLGTAIAKYVSEHKARGDVDAVSATVTVALCAYVAIALVATPVLFFAAQSIAALVGGWQEPQHIVTDVVRLVALGVPPLLLLSATLGIASGLERFEVPMVVLISQNVMTLFSAFAVVGAGGSVLWVVASSLAVLWVVAVGAVTFAVIWLRRIGVRPALSAAHARETVSYVGLTSITSVGIAAFGTADRLVVGAVLGLRAVSYYTVSIAIANKLLAFADVLTRPLLPAASAAFGGGPTTVGAAMARWTRLVATVCITLAAVLLVASKPLLTAWIGTKFATHALTTFRILIVVYALIAIAAPAYHTANGVGLAGLCAACAIVGGIATIALIAILSPHFGVAGAAVANAAYLVNLAIPLYLRKRLNAPRTGGA